MPPGSRYLGFGGVAERFAQMLSTRRVAVVANGGAVRFNSWVVDDEQMILYRG
jgi:hypothetical protein